MDEQVTADRSERDDRATAAALAQVEVEDLIAASSEADALSRLQDFIADYAPSRRDAIMNLRARHEAVRASIRAQTADQTVVNAIRNEILELTYDAIDACIADSPPPAPTGRGDNGRRTRGRERRERPETPAAQPPPLPAAEPTAGAPEAPAPQAAAPEADRATLESASDWTAPPMTAPPKRPKPPEPPKPPADVVCRLEGVSRSFGRGRFTLDPITLDIRRGEITAVVGRNASGKTTLLRMMMGDLLPTSGSISYPALEQNSKKRRRDWHAIKSRIASVPQLPDKWHGRLRHNLNYIAAIYGRREQDLERFIDWHLARYELMRYNDRAWDEISGGYKIRFELVRALLSQPQLLILDEPLAYLDVIAVERFLRDLRAIATSRENPLPVVITSQHISEIESVVDQIVLIDDGVLKYVGRVDDIAAERRFRMLEISVKAPQGAVEAALAGAQLHAIEMTVEGFVLALPKNVEVGQVFTRLSAAFGDRFTALRDITGSVRSLMSDLGA